MRKRYGVRHGPDSKERYELAMKDRVDEDLRRCDGRGDDPRDMSKRSKIVAPIAKFTAEGELVWNEDIVKAVKNKFEKAK